MPKLARLRFVSIGHNSARMQDLTLDFCDQAGSPSDSILWLRNGGGKSSILSLFFALPRPSRRDFLGSRSDAKQRRIEDYVAQSDRSIVVAEWVLDVSSSRLDFGEEEQPRFVTGVFYEYASGNRDALRRLYFCARSSTGVEGSTIHGLPIEATSVDGGRMRRTLTSFKQAWHELGEAHPSLQFSTTEVIGDWAERLQRVGIDPGLFGYQLLMNSREGAADEIFRFNTPEAFIDFLLELTVEPSKADGISENLETFRKQLQLRKHELLPDLKLSTGLIERLTPLVDLRERRLRTQEESKNLNDLHAQIRFSIAENTKGLTLQVSEIAQHMAEHRTQYVEAEARGHRHRAVASALALRLSEREHETAKLSVENLRQSLDEAERERTLWRAAYPYRNYAIAQQDIVNYRELLSGETDRCAPLLETLEDVAGNYVAAMMHQAKLLRERQEAQRELYNARDEESRAIEGKAAECERAASALDAEGLSYRKNIESRDRQYEKLLSYNIIASTETPQEALARIREDHKKLQAKLQTSQRAREGDAALEDEMGRLIQDLQNKLATSKGDLHALRREYDQGIAARDALEASATLQRCLELEIISLDDLPDDTAPGLHRRAGELSERIARLRTESAALERARVHLQEHGLMPPSVEVEALLAFLQKKIPAKSGWAYIHDRQSDDIEARRRLVKRYPALAQGIVVSARDLDRVRQLLLDNPDRTPPLPIVIASPEAFDGESQDSGIFIAGPKDDAWFEKTSAHKALANLEQRLSALGDDIAKSQTAQSEFAESALKLKAFRAQYPQGWYSAQQAKLAQIQVAIEDEHARLELQNDEKRRISNKKRDTERNEERLRSDIKNAEIMMERLRPFVEEVDASIDAWAATFEEKSRDSRRMKSEAETLRAQAKEIRDEARRILDAANPFAEEARLLENAIASVRYVKGKPAPKQGNLDELRSRYEKLREQVERELGNEEILRNIETTEAQARKEKKDVERILRDFKGKLSIDDVRAAVEALDNPNDIDANEKLARDAIDTIRAHYDQAIRTLSLKESEQKQRHDKWLGEGKPEIPQDLAHDLSQDAIEACEHQAKLALEALSKIERSIRDLERKVAERKHTQEALGKDLERLNSVQRSHAAFLEQSQVAAQELTLIDIADISAAISDLEQRLEKQRDANATLDTARTTAVRELRKWASDDQFATLQNRIVTQFKNLEAELLENNAADYRDALSTRIREISATLEEIEKHRVLLAKFLLSAADDGLRLIKLADAASIMPPEVPDIGGSRFLRITSKEPAHQTDRLELIQELVDTLVDEANMPTGIKLIQRAVRQLAHPFTVRALNPDPASPQRLIDITEIARFSGGEQLTCAILLYCTLANVRARTRGMNRQETSVLILDNPIGRASRVVFIDMQRAFARALGIQLIYTTAIGDLEALSIFPNVIRLRNERIDRNRGQRFLEHEQNTHGNLEAVRVGKIEKLPLLPDDDTTEDENE